MTFDLRQYIRDHAPAGLPVFKPHEWAELVQHYPVDRKAEVYAAIGDHLVENKVPFPRLPLTQSDAMTAFRGLRKASWEKFLLPISTTLGENYTARQAYRNWTASCVRGVVGLGAPYNDVSDYFQWQNRLRCRGWSSKSPLELWENPDSLRAVDWIFYSFPEDRARVGVTRDDYVGTFRLRTYTATQFRPQVAKAFFDWLETGTIFDISCGWGDRLAGFYTSKALRYIGCDPNRAVWEAYRQQCEAYEHWYDWTVIPAVEDLRVDGYDAFRVRGNKEVLIVNGPAEDIDWARWTADLVFASPPYFAVERYAEDQGPQASANQSWSKFSTFEAWRDGFLFPVIDKVSAQLRSGGVIALNMADATIGPTRYEACDPLIDRMVGQGMIYEGVVAMAMKKRPSMDPGDRGKRVVATKYAEPVWLLRRPGPELPRIGAVQDDFLKMFEG